MKWAENLSATACDGAGDITPVAVGESGEAFIPGARFDVTGVLVPAPSGAVFRLKPRMSTDVQPR